MSEPRYVIEEVTDSEHTARIRAQLERFSRNSDWLAANWADVLPQARGRHIAVACQQAFIADTPEQALALAKAAHPDDDGLLLRYVPAQLGPRIYAHRW
jgi:hypothetical protein